MAIYIVILAQARGIEFGHKLGLQIPYNEPDEPKTTILGTGLPFCAPPSAEPPRTNLNHFGRGRGRSIYTLGLTLGLTRLATL